MSHHSLITASDRLYFAYGTTLSPDQMARRCPDSIFLGKATLRGHRWQINERGVANITPTPRGRQRQRHGGGDPGVEGLLYAVSTSDERALDRREGGARGRERRDIEVDFEPVRDNVFARCTSASVGRAVREEREAGFRGTQRPGRKLGPREDSLASSILGLLGVPRSTRRARSPSPARGRSGRGGRARSVDGGRGAAARCKPVVAIVYADTAHVRDGEVRPGYVPRMERAMADATALGVSRGFVGHMAGQIRESSSTWKSSWRRSLAGVEGLETGRRATEVTKRRSVSQSDGPRRHKRRDSVVDDGYGDY
ncbi:hypothetical protein Daus18300_004986 [Diaporthe australafricana]|uniref:gamma-glutamylcyclotransferase n=1 Tax=Diaporthe australafricana TaxID=127596 RepID=A0ABR3X5E6_9PEZI